MLISEPLARASRVVSYLSAAGAVLVPAGTALAFVSPIWAQRIGMEFRHGLSHLGGNVPFNDRLFACFFAMLPAAIATFGLVALTRLLQLYSKGDVFGRDALKALGQITTALFWYAVAAFVTEAPITWFLTRNYPSHRGELQLTIQAGDIEILFFAAVALVIARVMAEPRRVADENEAFV